MKKLIGFLAGVVALGITSVIAYTPSSELQEQLEVATEKLETLMSQKDESFREHFLSLVEEYKEKYSENERALYILSYLGDSLSRDLSTTNISSQYTGTYSIDNSEYGTQTYVTISGDTRQMITNALPNHDTGDFPNSGNPNTISAQDKSYSLDLTPNYTGDANWARESGVAYNGVKFELETAERVECESGEVYKIEAIQDMTDLGLDHNHAHVQPTGEYHYHGAAKDLIENLEGDDVVHIGYASDGFPLYYSKNNTYTPSYSLIDDVRAGTSCSYRGKDVTIDGTTPDGTYVSDWEYDASGDLDQCNGISLNGEYSYFITDGYPYGPRCMNGEYTSSQKGGQGTGTRQGPPPRR